MARRNLPEITATLVSAVCWPSSVITALSEPSSGATDGRDRRRRRREIADRTRQPLDEMYDLENVRLQRSPNFSSVILLAFAGNRGAVV